MASLEVKWIMCCVSSDMNQRWQCAWCVCLAVFLAGLSRLGKAACVVAVLLAVV